MKITVLGVDMIFKNRKEAALLLLKKLSIYKGQRPLVLGIPRGAMPMAKIIAEGLNGELNAILIHKIPAPGHEELAIGSVGLSGKIYRLPHIEQSEISEEYVEKVAQDQMARLQNRQVQYHLPPFNCKDRIVIIVDDGIATGATAIEAIREVKVQKPRELIVAAPVVSASSAGEIRELVDKLINLEEPEFFYAVSQFYEDFKQVTDEQVIELLK